MFWQSQQDKLHTQRVVGDAMESFKHSRFLFISRQAFSIRIVNILYLPIYILPNWVFTQQWINIYLYTYIDIYNII